MGYNSHSVPYANFRVLNIGVFDVEDKVLHITPKESTGVKSSDLGRQAIGCPLPIHPSGIHHDVTVVTTYHLASDVVLCPVGRQFHVVNGEAHTAPAYPGTKSRSLSVPKKIRARSPPFGALSPPYIHFVTVSMSRMAYRFSFPRVLQLCLFTAPLI